VYVIYNWEALGLNFTVNTCYLDWYFDGFAHTVYTSAAIVQLESISSTPCVYLYTVITESLQLQEYLYTAKESGLATLESVQPLSARIGF
jgi:hypothetical protein